MGSRQSTKEFEKWTTKNSKHLQIHPTALVQNDLKRVIAYSTCSQLGYMVFACGTSNYNVGIFHLSNHAFFKALLFLSAGSVIHALADNP